MRFHLSTEKRIWKPVYRHQLFRFSNQTAPEDVPPADLNKPEPIQIIAWAIRHFGPLVKDYPEDAWKKMMTNTPIKDYITPSDLAFIILVLEHYLSKWRRLVQFKLENGGRKMSEEDARRLEGLLYEGGIADEPAKRRFDSLQVYFYLQFYSGMTTDTNINMTRLQRALDAGTNFDFDLIDLSVKNHKEWTKDHPTMDQIKKDVVHRIFYCLH